MSKASSLIAFCLLLCTGCQFEQELNQQITAFFEPISAKQKKEEKPSQPIKKESQGAIEYEKTMARIEAERTAEHAKWNRPLSEDYSTYLFEVGQIKSKIWFYPDGRYAMRRPDKLMGSWSTRHNIMVLQSHRGEKWVFQPLPSGTYESKSHSDTWLIPLQK
jgi:hypothetical protein